MELDQILFKKVAGLYRKWKAKHSAEEISRTIYLPDISSRLTLIARALTGINIDIIPAEQEGGWKNNAFYLPGSFSLLSTQEENLNFYIYRVVYLSILLQSNLNWDKNILSPTLEESRKMAGDVSPLILDIMEQEYESVSRFYHSIEQHFNEEQNPPFWLHGKYMVPWDVAENNQGRNLDKNAAGKDSVNPSTELASKPVEEVEVISVDKKAQDDYVMTHNFEKVETAEEFNGVWRGFDGDDSLSEDAEALNELNLKHLVRSDETVHSVYQADFRDLETISESAGIEDHETCLQYNEWNFSKKKYRNNYCNVYLKKTKGGDPNYANTCLKSNSKTLNALRRKFAQIHQKRELVNKLPDGESMDIDALVDWYADLKSGRTPSDNIYLSKRKKEPDLAVLFLMDLSLSTDSYVDGNRVLDVEKQAVLLFGEVLNEYRVDFSVSGFYSKTRNNCAYLSFKDFGESWVTGKQKLGAIRPQGYTRIGPALRHSQTLISKHSAAQKWVILLSDGKPNDYDKYEGKYGIADVKQALREMNEQHINTYAIAIESIARYYLPQMFGQNHYNILSHPDKLISSLTMLYQRINNG